jgi:hypothetical protein
MKDVAVGSGKLPRPKRTTFPSESTILVPFHTSSFSNIGKAIIYMISPGNSTFDLLSKLLMSIESYPVYDLHICCLYTRFFHPSNSGQWTDNLGLLIRELCRSYSKRVGDGNTNH